MAERSARINYRWWGYPAESTLQAEFLNTLPLCCIKFRVQKPIEQYIWRCTEFLLDWAWSFLSEIQKKWVQCLRCCCRGSATGLSRIFCNTIVYCLFVFAEVKTLWNQNSDASSPFPWIMRVWFGHSLTRYIAIAVFLILLTINFYKIFP